MSLLNVRPLTPDDEPAFFEGLRDWEAEDLSWYTFVWKPGMSFSEMLHLLETERQGVHLPKGWVPADMLYGFLGGRIVGRVSIRHRLNAQLLKRGGHVGYAVSPLFRSKGIGYLLAKAALQRCKEIGLSEVLITCAEKNLASVKIIEKLGGADPERKWDPEEEEWVHFYWVKANEF